MSKKSIENALSVLETEKANLSPEQRQRLADLAKTGEDVRSDVAETLETAEKRELSPEQADKLLGILKTRFDKAPDNKELRQAIDFADVEKSLRANPEILFSIQKLEETGGEPQIICIEDDEYIIEDRSVSSPSGRRNKNFDQADAQRKSFGPNVKFQSSDSYRGMQKTGEFDRDSRSWLETSDETIKSGRALYGDRYGGGVHVRLVACRGSGDTGEGWRASLRVKKV
jgi:hypothetical protein